MKKILAIDDKMDNLVTLAALLKNLMSDCTVITAQSGLEGIAKAKAELPDVILLDIIMPEMDGFETCRRLMSDESTKHIPVIMITAIKTDPQSRIKGLETGANAFLSKPIDEVELVSQVKVVLRIKEAEDDLRMERDSLERMVEERTAILKESEERFRSLVESTSDWIWAIDAENRYFYASPKVLEFLGYTPEEVLGKTPFDFMPSKEAARLKSDFQKISDARRPFRGLENVNLRKNGETIILETSGVPIFDATGQFGGYHGVDRDITERKRAEEQLRQTFDRLRKALNTTIQVMVSVVEARDPYTSGHQLRSADLARGIATEMGFSQERIEAIEMVASIHDIGKLSIPAEILSKPTKLSDIEFSLIKEHARRGFEMLKDVESPWPLAEIVYQHHERMDGTGYPRNLQGEEILIEARILAVADVVEAMASHRPYRAGLGIEAAMEEIEKNSAIFYDKTVADACLRLFRSKGFQLAGV